MDHEKSDQYDRLRRKFCIKDADAIGFAGAAIVKADPQVTATERVLEFIATTEDVDLDDEVVLASGADWSYFESVGCRSLYLDHHYNQENHVGVIRSIAPFVRASRQVGWKMRAHVFTGLKCPTADDVWTKSQQTNLGVSIGFIPLEVGTPDQNERKTWPKAESIIRRWKAIEVSVTGTPANQQARTLSVPDDKVSPKKLVVEIARHVVEI